jgi:perosamine synthetase
MLVHMFGLMSSEIPAIRALCRARGVALIEDAAHAHGASVGGLNAGALGLAGCFSYYATKVLTTGEGGVVTTDDDDFAARVRQIRDHGRRDGAAVYDYPGNNYRLAEIAAILGCVQHRRLPEILSHRRRVAAIYREALDGAPHLTLIDPPPHAGHSYWRYALLLDHSVDRLAVQSMLLERERARVTWMYEPLCHQQPYYSARPEHAVQLPVAEGVVGRLINLPTHLGVDEAGARAIASTLRMVVGELAASG